ncbi:2-dehydropantoate 2-reductase [Pseudomonas sp. FP2335]|uniref:ketopantoate reductase family protein n=1 Tax=Pseudomonas sp. FP2335 TaxID=2954092 RepID=UPI002732DE4C|nr:2-dehydropantoate 2-reductase [Pseudomonas sp. FP2335]WLH81754.1 2-dehydropantoate 2-reductase [Pseudomonas sp. FP2335]
MRIGIIGAGAMGGLFGGRLAAAGHAVSFVEVSSQTIDAIRENGLHILGDETTVSVWPQIGVAAHFEEPFELMLVFTKGFHTQVAMDNVRHLIAPSTWVLSVQNGLGNAELIAQVVSAERIIVGMTDFPAQRRSPGTIYSQGHGHVKIWSYTGAPSDEIATIAQSFDEAGLNCAADANVQVAIWEKLAFNSVLNSICSVCGLTVGQVGRSEGGPALASAMAAEAVAVAAATGVLISNARIMAAIEHAFLNHSAHKPSMLQDIEAGRQTENAFIAGAIVKLGREHQVPTPVTESLYTLVGMKEGVATAG